MLMDTVKVSSTNSWFHVAGDPTFNNEFFNVDKTVIRSFQRSNETKNTMIRVNFYRSPLLKKHDRQVYGFIDLIGDLGGILEVIMAITGGFIFPIS